MQQKFAKPSNINQPDPGKSPTIDSIDHRRSFFTQGQLDGCARTPAILATALLFERLEDHGPMGLGGRYGMISSYLWRAAT